MSFPNKKIWDQRRIEEESLCFPHNEVVYVPSPSEEEYCNRCGIQKEWTNDFGKAELLCPSCTSVLDELPKDIVIKRIPELEFLEF